MIQKLKALRMKLFHTTKILVFRKKPVKYILITVLICSLICMIAPFIGLPIFLNQHVSYRGYVTEDYPLQDIYYASDFNLIENQISLTTEDGLNLWASEIYTEKPEAVIIYLTGIVQPSITYFYSHAKLMQEHGYASILLEVRGHGNSDGDRICLGYEEVEDVRAAINYIKSDVRYAGIPIILHGVSMGGAIAVNSFGQIEEIDALIAMSAYSSFEDVATDIMDVYDVPKFLQNFEKPFIRASLKLIFSKDKVTNLTPEKQIKNTNQRPVLLIACTGDVSVPPINSQRLHKAYPDAQLWIRDSWEHFIIENCDFKNLEKDREYCDKIIDFIRESITTR